MQSVAQKIQDKYKKPSVVGLKSGDTVRVHQKIVEGGKERIQVFEGLVIRTGRGASLTSTFTVRRIASGVGVEKTYLIHSPNVLKIEITKRSKVRRNYLSYMRTLTGKSARLTGVDFDRQAVNAANKAVEAEEEKIAEQHAEQHDEIAAEIKEEKAAEVEIKPEEPKTEAEKLEAQPVEKAEAKGPATPQNKE